MGRKYSTGAGYPPFGWVGVFLAIVFTAILFSSVARAAVVYSGKLTSIQGNVEIGRQGSSATVQAKFGDSLFEGDNVKTGEGSKVEITFLDNSIVRVSANSSMRIRKSAYNKAEEKRNISISAFRGAFRMMVMKVVKVTSSGSFRPWRDSKFTVETPTAVVGVKGTKFFIEIDKNGDTTTTVFDGVVSQKHANPNIGGEVLIGKNKTSKVTEYAPPDMPKDAPPEQLQALLDTTDDGSTETAATEEGTTDEATTETTDTATTDTATTELFGYTEEGLTTDTVITDTVATTTDTTIISGGGGTTCGTLPCI
ncbi:MAG: FecR family protein [Thermodesulfobacteriota bacterium]